MLINEAVIENNLNDLPPRVKKCLVSYLSPKDRLKLRVLSKTWYEYINESLGVGICFGNKINSGTFFDRHERLKICSESTASQIGISSIYFLNLNQVQIPTFKNIDLIKRINFSSYVTQLKFVKILKQLTKVEHLQIDIAALQFLNIDEITEFESLVSGVKIFEITNETGLFYLSFDFDDMNESTLLPNELNIIFENFSNLLTLPKFNSLQKLIISSPLFQPYYYHYSTILNMLEFIKKHSKTLSSIRLEFYEIASLTKRERSNSTFYMGSNAEIELNEPTEAPDEILEKFKTCEFSPELNKSLGLALKEVEISFLSFLEANEAQSNHEEFWRKFMSSLTGLKKVSLLKFEEKFEISSCLELPFPTELILNNPDIEEFRWLFKVEGSNIDLVPFENLKKLRKLYLSSIEYLLASSIALNIFSLTSLPHLAHFSVFGINLRSDDIEIIATQLAALETLELFSVMSFEGENRDMGMRAETLRHIYNEKRIREVRLHNAFHEGSFEVTRGAKGAFSFILKYLQVEEYSKTLFMKLDEDGEYAYDFEY